MDYIAYNVFDRGCKRMGATLRLRDEYFDSPPDFDCEVPSHELVSERISAREIICQRVRAEVEAQNAQLFDESQRTRSFIIDIKPDSPEGRLNKAIKPRARQLLQKADAEIEDALAAFGQQRIVMLFDDRQIEDLDEELTVLANSEVVFLYLTPLRGG